MRHNISTGALLLTTLSLCCSHLRAQNYDDVFYAMPNMTLDQRYNALMDFQRANPYHGNTYLQLGIVCENKMIHLDPLRDNAAVQFWAANAKLFLGNLRVYYKSGDIRSNEEYYANLHIPVAGKHAEDADLWAFVRQHETLCKNHSDTTKMIYEAIESAKANYNKSLTEYMSICSDYYSLNELLLQHNSSLDERMKSVQEHMQKCISDFQEYKRLTKLYPVMNYNQFYEFKDIETFRLDGLTNSDFYVNRFFVWDYGKWIDQYYAKLKSDVLPLRSEVEQINAKYEKAREEYAAQKPQEAVLSSPYDEFFLFRLGRYDNSSLVRELFAYREQVRQLEAMAGDSLIRYAWGDSTLMRRKMRHVYRMLGQAEQAKVARRNFSDAITPDRVVRFKDFFSKNYGGEKGLKDYAGGDAAYCQSLIDDAARLVAVYADTVAAKRSSKAPSYSEKSGNKPALPLWASLDPKAVSGKYVTTMRSYGFAGRVSHVVGHLKADARSWFVGGVDDAGATAWVTTLKNVNSITDVKSLRSGCMVAAVRKLKPAIILLDETGKEVHSVEASTDLTDEMGYEPISGRMYWVTGSAEGAPVLTATDSLGVKAWDASLSGSLKSVARVLLSTKGYMVVGTNHDGKVSYVNVGKAGSVADVHPLEAVSLVEVMRLSSSEVAFLVRKSDGKVEYVVVND